MGKRVIKINLVGAICVLILAVAIIIGLIVGIPKIINKMKVGKHPEKSNVIDENTEFVEKVTNDEGKEIESKLKICKSEFGYTMKYDYELFTVEKNINGIDRFVSLYSNTIGVTVQKQKGKFNRLPEYLNNSIQSNDMVNSSNTEYSYYSGNINSSANVAGSNNSTNSSNFNYSSNSGMDEERVILQELFKRLSEGIRMDNVREFNTIQTEFAGKQAFKRTLKNDQTTDYIYCVKIDEENFYVIHAYCGEGFTDEVLPVLENMVNSFTITEEK